VNSELRVRYPVIVTYTSEHVVWVEADSQQQAVDYASSEPYEYTDDHETLAESGWTVEAPDDYSGRSLVEEGGYYHPYKGTDAKAHVESWRGHLRYLEQEALNAEIARENDAEDAGTLAEADRVTCRACKRHTEAGHYDTGMHTMNANWAKRDAAREVPDGR
jgi:hypothetical protein